MSFLALITINAKYLIANKKGQFSPFVLSLGLRPCFVNIVDFLLFFTIAVPYKNNIAQIKS